MRLFVYPEVRHARIHAPRMYKDYHAYRDCVEEEFGGVCVYCRLPNFTRSKLEFQIDHYRPKSIFPSHICDYANLFWCCAACNVAKSNYWPARGLRDTEFIPNPCDHKMHDHLEFDGLTVTARTKAGSKAVELLRLNSTDWMIKRERMLLFAESNSENQKSVQIEIASLSEQLMALPAGKDDEHLRKELASCELKLHRLKEIEKDFRGIRWAA